jgi:hypothetical protein
MEFKLEIFNDALVGYKVAISLAFIRIQAHFSPIFNFTQTHYNTLAIFTFDLIVVNSEFGFVETFPWVEFSDLDVIMFPPKRNVIKVTKLIFVFVGIDHFDSSYFDGHFSPQQIQIICVAFENWSYLLVFV